MPRLRSHFDAIDCRLAGLKVAAALGSAALLARTPSGLVAQRSGGNANAGIDRRSRYGRSHDDYTPLLLRGALGDLRAAVDRCVVVCAKSDATVFEACDSLLRNMSRHD